MSLTRVSTRSRFPLPARVNRSSKLEQPVNSRPRPQKVPPPIDVPPTRSHSFLKIILRIAINRKMWDYNPVTTSFLNNKLTYLFFMQQIETPEPILTNK